MFLEPVDDTTDKIVKEIMVEHPDLSETIEDPLHLERISAKNMQEILGEP